MRKILIFVAFYTQIFALDANYQKALEFEKMGDYKNAMIFYKKVAAVSQTPEQMPSCDEEIINEEEIFGKTCEITEEEPQKIEMPKKEQTGTKKPEILIKPGENFKNQQNFNNQNFNKQTPQKNETQNFQNSPKIAIYEPIFVLGAYDFNNKADRENFEVKFGFGVEIPLFYDIFGFGEKFSFAYSQKSWWQIGVDSAPFRESNYKPEIFMQIPLETLKYAQFGALHESNGQSGFESRSWNKIYAETAFGSENFTLSPRIWWAFLKDDTNADIEEFLGYGELRASYKIANHELNAKWRNNLNFSGENRGSIELGWFFPLFGDFYGYLNYFSGYGESLIDYNRHIDKIALGVAYK